MKKELLIISLIILILLFNMKVKADELDSNAWVSFYTDEQHNNALPAQGYYQYYTLNNNTNQNTQIIYMSSTFTRNNNFDYIAIPYLLLGNTTTTGTYTSRRYECSWREVNDNGNYYYVPNTCGYDTSAGGNYDTQNIPIDSNLRISIVLTDGNVNAPCKLEKDSITCQLQKDKNYNRLILTYTSNGLNSSTGLKIGFNYVVGMYKNSQNAIVEGQQQIINSNTSYEGINQSEEINGSEELTSYEQDEQNLLDSLNMTEVENLDITINPNASTFIWTVIESLRTISSKIVVLMTSILGLGVIKLLLNR